MSPIQFIREVCQRSVAFGLMDMSKVCGWSDDEIYAAESALGLRLPAYYCQFLRVLGRNGGGLLIGTHIFPRGPDEFPKWRSFATRLMAASGATLPHNAVVFGDHQGYQFWYFIVPDAPNTDDAANDDPPVFYYHEGEPHPRQVSPSFTEFLSKSVEEGHQELQWLAMHKARADAARAAFRAQHGDGGGTALS